MFDLLRAELEPKHVALVAVSKTQPNDAILVLYDQGQRLFGENRAQELVAKADALPKDIQWHLIGHLQTNKVKYVAPFVAMIQSVDSLDLLHEINRQAIKNGRVIPCLLQFKIAEEATKFGFDAQDATGLDWREIAQNHPNVQFCGVMGMATFTEASAQVRREFRQLKMIFDTLKKRFFHDMPAFREISMGMSGDYQIAVEEGSTMVRIGSLIFGERAKI